MMKTILSLILVQHIIGSSSYSNHLMWRPGHCPVTTERLDCTLVSNECIVDIDCANGWKCCSDGCILKCVDTRPVKKPITPKPKLPFGQKPGKCFVVEEPQECPLIVYNECLLDNECPGTLKCCDVGCHQVCVNINGTIPSEPKERKECPAVKGDIYCTDKSFDQCQWDKQCFGGQKCCFDGCKFMCTGEPKKTAKLACHEPVDIGFLMDTSGSLSQKDFNLAKYFLLKTINNFHVSKKDAHFSIFTFASSVKKILSFEQGASQTVVNSALDAIPYSKGNSRIDLGIQKVAKEMFKKSSGMRRHVPKYLIVLTDGKITYSKKAIDFVKMANKIKAKGVEIYSVGISKDINVSAMIEIASSYTYVFKMSDYSAMVQINRRFSQKLCKKATKSFTKYNRNI